MTLITEVPPKRRQTLMDISADAQALRDLLEELEGDITGCDTIVDEWLMESREALHVKLDGYCAIIREEDLRAKAMKDEQERVTARRKAHETTAARLKDRLKWFFENEGIDKVETARFKVALQNNGGVVPLLLDVEPEQLPVEFQRVTITADNEKLREALAGGDNPLPFAHLGDRGRAIRIR